MIDGKTYSFVSGDPGKANFSLTFVTYKHDITIPFESRFGLKWFALFDFGGARSANGKKIRDTNSVLDDWKAMEKSLDENTSLNRILSGGWIVDERASKNRRDDEDDDGSNIDDHIKVLLESVEGVNIIEVLSRLIRVNFLIGCLVSWITMKFDRNRVNVQMVGKTLKYGINTLNKEFKERYTVGSIAVKNPNIPLSDMKKPYRKRFACGMIRSMVHASKFTSNDMKTSVRSTSDTHFEHVADAVSQTMAYVASMLTRTQLFKPPYDDMFDKFNKSPLIEAVEYTFVEKSPLLSKIGYKRRTTIEKKRKNDGTCLNPNAKRCCRRHKTTISKKDSTIIKQNRSIDDYIITRQ